MTTVNDQNTMTLSKSTFEILKNYATINPNICFQKGNKIVVLSPTKNIMSEATIDEEFTEDVRIYELNRFLSTVSLLTNPKMDLRGDHLVISGDSGARIKVRYADPAIVVPVKERLKMPHVISRFDISAKNLADLLKASSVMQLPNLTFSYDASDDGGGTGCVSARLHDKKDPTSNEYELSLPCSYAEVSFKVTYSIEALKMIPGDYTLELSKGAVTRFTSCNDKLCYYIAAEFSNEIDSSKE